MPDDLQPVKAPKWQHATTINHGFFSRVGGVSSGLYASLNTGMGSNDDLGCVHENKTRIAHHLNITSDRLVTVHQIHSAEVAFVTDAFPDAARPRLDAMVTSTPGLALCILTADCGPVLFADERNGIVGAAHAGWKGALAGIIGNTVEAMTALGAQREHIRAMLGPCIGPQNYEVGPEFRASFMEADPENGRFFSVAHKPDHYMFDLPAYIVDAAQQAKIEAKWTGQCTYEDEQRFFSYRRTTHRKEPDYGRQLSAIMVKE